MTLTVALAILGGLVLAALVAHGAWTARRASPRQADATPPPARVEPALGESTNVIAPVAHSSTSAEVRSSATRRQARLDALVDAIVPLALDTPVRGEAVLAHEPPSRAVQAPSPSLSKA